MTVRSGDLYAVIEATWPAAAKTRLGPWMIRSGQGGGQRVSAATAEGPVAATDLKAAETAMADLGQPNLFMIRDTDTAVDKLLEAAGYVRHDPVTMYAAPVDLVATEAPPRTAAVPAWEPLKIMEEIWATGGIGPDRVAVMHRAASPKTGFISRWQDKPAAAGFCAIHNRIAMVHALEVLPFQRRLGVGHFIMRRAAFWARDHGASTLSVICTTANQGANALYASLGMSVVGQYHYRLKRPDKGHSN